MNSNIYLLSEFITTRICHDLAGASSAIANGVEFLSGDDDFVSEAKDLIAMSSNAIGAKIKLFRLAFGLVDKRLADFESLKQTLNEYFKENNNITINWQQTSVDDFDVNQKIILGRLILLTGIISSDILPRGGILTIKTSPRAINIAANSDKLIMNQELNNIITLWTTNLDTNEIIENTTPKNIPLTYALITGFNADITTQIISETGKLEFTFNLN